MALRKKQLSAFEQASVLRENALTGFRSAYDILAESNVLLVQDAEDQRQAAIAYREQLENAIRVANRREADARELAATNQASIDTLAGILGK